MVDEKKNSRKLFYVAAIISAVAALASLLYFNPLVPTTTIEGDIAKDSAVRIAVLTDANFRDKGWGESSLKAAEYIEQKYNLTVAKEDNIAIADIETILRRYADSGYNLIIAHGVQWGEPSLQVAKTYPQAKFVVFTGLVESENVASIFPQQQEGSFLLGVIAGMMSSTGTVGFIGGEEYPNVINIYEGYKAGALWANANITVLGTYLNDWDNPARGKEAATSIIRQGADFVFHVADSSGQGVIQAAQENRVYALGAVQDQNHLAPGTVLSSFVLDVDKAYDNSVQLMKQGDLTGKIFRPGLELQRNSTGDGIVYLAPFHDLDEIVPEAVKSRIQELTIDIIDGRVVIPEKLQ